MNMHPHITNAPSKSSKEEKPDAHQPAEKLDSLQTPLHSTAEFRRAERTKDDLYKSLVQAASYYNGLWERIQEVRKITSERDLTEPMAEVLGAALKDMNYDDAARRRVVGTLAALGDPKQIVPMFIQALGEARKNKESLLIKGIAYELGVLREDASIAAPALAKEVELGNTTAAEALEKMGPAALAALPTLKHRVMYYEGLSDMDVRGASLKALVAIQGFAKSAGTLLLLTFEDPYTGETARRLFLGGLKSAAKNLFSPFKKTAALN